jgi:hypothetical protein
MNNKTEHFVTIFDFNFLPQGLSLYQSLENNTNDFILWIVCIDQETMNFLTFYNKPYIKLILLKNLETDELRSVKSMRKKVEYYWTLTPFCPFWIFQADSMIDRVTYLDADMFFFKDPKIVIDKFEASGKSVLLTDHSYDIEYDLSAYSGKYCVQFITFNRKNGLDVLHWWQNQCVNWCFARFEDNKFGDQKYIEKFEELFPDQIYVAPEDDLFMAPWNARRFHKIDPVAFHFHGLRLMKNKKINLYKEYYIPDIIFNKIYIPYKECLCYQLKMIGKPIIQEKSPSFILNFKFFVKFFVRVIKNFSSRNKIIKI